MVKRIVHILLLSAVTSVLLTNSAVSAPPSPLDLPGTCSNAGTWWDGFGRPGADNSVQALGKWDGKLVAAGSFRSIDGVANSGVAVWDGARWTPIGSTILGDGIVCMTQFGSDLIVAGTFSSIESPKVRNIAKWDGIGWGALGSGLTSASKVLHLTDIAGRLTAAGTAGVFELNGSVWSRVDGFTSPINAATTHMGKLVIETDGGIWEWSGVLWVQLGQIQGSCSCMSSYLGLLFIGGIFDLNGTETYLASFDGVAWRPINADVVGQRIDPLPPRAMSPTSQGLIIGWDLPGFLYSFDGTQLTDFSGGAITGATPWYCYPDLYEYIVLSLIEYDGSLVVGGRFYQADTLPVSNLVSFTSSGASILGHAQGLVTVRPMTFLGAGDDGAFAYSPVPHPCEPGTSRVHDIYEWRGANWRRIGGWSGFYSIVTLHTIIDGRLYLAGRGSAGDFQSIAEWDGEEWVNSLPIYGSQQCCANLMYSLARYGSTFVAGGSIPPPSGDVSETQVGILNAGVWSPLGSSFHGSQVDALVEHQGQLIAGGNFESTGATALNGIARWNGIAWGPMGEGLGSVKFLASSGDQLIAAGGSPALWDGVQWVDIGAGLDFHSGPDQLSNVDGCILMTGMAMAGRPKSLLMWDGNSWSEFIYGAEGTFGKFNSDYYFAAGAPVFGEQRPARWIASGQSAVVEIPPPKRHGLTISIAQNPIAGSLVLQLSETSTPNVIVDIFDVAGRRVVSGLVATPSSGRLLLSPRELTDNGSAIQNGVYLVRVSDGKAEATAKFIVLH